MKLHLITIGKPKLGYARDGWAEYLSRLQRQHSVRVTHLGDKHATDAAKILDVSAGSYRVGLIIEAEQLSSHQLAELLRTNELDAREVSFIIGGPDGLPPDVQSAVDLRLSLSKLTLPHDLAMVALAEALYRASTLNAGTPYHH